MIGNVSAIEAIAGYQNVALLLMIIVVSVLVWDYMTNERKR